MAQTVAQKKAKRKWDKENLDRIEIQPRKGTKERYKQEADRRGQSMTEFVTMCVEKELNRNKKEQE